MSFLSCGLALLCLSAAPPAATPSPPLLSAEGDIQTTELQARQIGLGDSSPKSLEQTAETKSKVQAFVHDERANFWSIGISAALDLPVAEIQPMASTRIDLRYRLPLPVGLMGEFGLRSGYSLRSFSGSVYDSALGTDTSALLALHSIPLLGTATLSYCTGRPVLFGLPARSALYGGLGAQLVYGQAQAFGRQELITSVLPAYLLGASFDIQQNPSLHYGLFAEWENGSAGLKDMPGLAPDTSALRLGLSFGFAFGGPSGEDHE